MEKDLEVCRIGELIGTRSAVLSFVPLLVCGY